jgi:hypothetical protein
VTTSSRGAGKSVGRASQARAATTNTKTTANSTPVAQRAIQPAERSCGCCTAAALLACRNRLSGAWSSRPVEMAVVERWNAEYAREDGAPRIQGGRRASADGHGAKELAGTELIRRSRVSA